MNKKISYHILLDLYDSYLINDTGEKILKILLKSVEISGTTVLGILEHKFEPHGFSTVILISESHISCHSWPEYNYISIDLFSCGSYKKLKLALNYIIEKFEPKKCVVKKIGRGNKLYGTTMENDKQSIKKNQS